MTDIRKLDPNFIAPSLNRPGLAWYNGRTAPFSLHGAYLPESGEHFCRIPRALAASLDPITGELNDCTAGIRLRFCTDSPAIAVKATRPTGAGKMVHMPYTGSAGLDVYVNGVFAGLIQTQYETPTVAEGLVTHACPGLVEVEINFPLYAPVGMVYIGLDEGARVLPPRPYRHTKPVVFYGSSITQGGCAGRPGLCYQAHLCRWLDTDYLNLGFSGHAWGEPALADYIASLDMSVFVMDYDHNAPNADHLRKTHAPLFRKVRNAHPTLPVVFVTKPDVHPEKPDSYRQDLERRAVIYATYQQAVRDGDRNVYFLDGGTFYPDSLRDSCSVDGCHPNDLGFFFMAAGMEKVLAPLLREPVALRGGTLSSPCLPQGMENA